MKDAKKHAKKPPTTISNTSAHDLIHTQSHTFKTHLIYFQDKKKKISPMNTMKQKKKKKVGK